MTVSAVPPVIDAQAFLAGAQFSDAFSIDVAGSSLTAREAAEAMLGRSPRWATALLRLRDLIVTPLGLKTSTSARRTDISKIGFFPLLGETPARVVAGFNDHHLDFRVVIDVTDASSGQRVTATTIVLMHNWLGRTYMAIITPFHRLVVRAMLKQVLGAVDTGTATGVSR